MKRISLICCIFVILIGVFYVKGVCAETYSAQNETFSKKFAYTITENEDSRRQWVLKTPKGLKAIIQSESNQKALESYRISVNNMSYKEILLIATGFTTIMALIGLCMALFKPVLRANIAVAVIVCFCIAAANIPTVMEWYNTFLDCYYYFGAV